MKNQTSKIYTQVLFSNEQKKKKMKGKEKKKEKERKTGEEIFFILKWCRLMWGNLDRKHSTSQLDDWITAILMLKNKDKNEKVKHKKKQKKKNYTRQAVKGLIFQL